MLVQMGVNINVVCLDWSLVRTKSMKQPSVLPKVKTKLKGHVKAELIDNPMIKENATSPKDHFTRTSYCVRTRNHETCASVLYQTVMYCIQ